MTPQLQPIGSRPVRDLESDRATIVINGDYQVITVYGFFISLKTVYLEIIIDS